LEKYSKIPGNIGIFTDEEKKVWFKFFLVIGEV